ncbi:DUF2283 domain-containing protein [candidate division KSB1 bacterium]|nr:DUF2283 domain-containing protein [candidate division KSB1 bacterium]MBL7095074.1 DUF2283 domain-containing protein [candidate division KSB1 bacterium]
MEISYDKTADALSIWFAGVTSQKTIDISKDIFVDIDAAGRLAGIEILHASEKVNLPDLLNLTLRIFPQDKEFQIQLPGMMNL